MAIVATQGQSTRTKVELACHCIVPSQAWSSQVTLEEPPRSCALATLLSCRRCHLYLWPVRTDARFYRRFPTLSRMHVHLDPHDFVNDNNQWHPCRLPTRHTRSPDHLMFLINQFCPSHPTTPMSVRHVRDGALLAPTDRQWLIL